MQMMANRVRSRMPSSRRNPIAGSGAMLTAAVLGRSWSTGVVRGYHEGGKGCRGLSAGTLRNLACDTEDERSSMARRETSQNPSSGTVPEQQRKHPNRSIADKLPQTLSLQKTVFEFG